MPYYIDVLHTKLSFNNGVAQQQDISTAISGNNAIAMKNTKVASNT